VVEINVFQYSSPQLAALVGIPERRLFSWIEQGYISPSTQEADGLAPRICARWSEIGNICSKIRPFSAGAIKTSWRHK